MNMYKAMLCSIQGSYYGYMQVLAIEETFKHRVKNVVFMGMGEPMLNLKSVLEAHRCLNKVSSLTMNHSDLLLCYLIL